MSDKATDIKKLSDDELDALKREVDAELSRRAQRRKASAEKQILEIAAQSGIDLRSLAEGVTVYRNPDNQFETWTGRGPKPRWVKKCIEQGLTLDKLRVPRT